MSEDNKLAVAENALQVAQEQMKDEEEKPVDLVERSAADMMRASFNDLTSDFEFQKAIHAELKKRLETASLPELITIDSNTSLAVNDKLNRLMNPVFNMMSTKMESEGRVKSASVNGGQASMQNFQSLNIPSNVLQSFVDKSLDGDK